MAPQVTEDHQWTQLLSLGISHPRYAGNTPYLMTCFFTPGESHIEKVVAFKSSTGEPVDFEAMQAERWDSEPAMTLATVNAATDDEQGALPTLKTLYEHFSASQERVAGANEERS